VSVDLSAADSWLAARDEGERKRRGQWPTPWWLCEAVVARLAPELPPEPRVVDPACGDGRWLLAVARQRPDARLVGIDNDPLAIEAAKATLLRAGVSAELVCTDALAPGVVPPCDVVVGNPPFVRPQHLPREVARALWARYALATDKCDLSVCFVELALQVAPRLALVLPANLLSLASFGATRAALLARGVDAIFRVPGDPFAATVEVVVVMAGPQDRQAVGEVSREGVQITGALSAGALAWSLDGALPELAGEPLGRYARLHMGVVCGDYPRYVHQERLHPEDRLTCRGRDVRRFHITSREEYLRYLPEDMLRRKPYVAPKSAGLFDVPAKVILAGTTGTELRAAVDHDRRFPLDSCYVVQGRSDEVDPYGLLGLLLSRPVGAWYGRRFRAARVKGVEIAQIPVPPPPWPEIAEAARARDERGLEEAVARAYSAVL
jgi:SAM-dependent methyltransferase